MAVTVRVRIGGHAEQRGPVGKGEAAKQRDLSHEHPPQDAIRPAGVQRVLALDLANAAQRLQPETAQHDDRKEIGAHVTLPLDNEARAVDDATQAARRVAASVSRNLVLETPEPLMGRDEQEQPSTGTKDPTPLAQSTDVVIDMLQDVHAGQHVKGFIWKRQLDHVRLPDGAETALSTESQRVI